MASGQTTLDNGIQLPGGLADFRRLLRFVGYAEVSVAVATLVLVVLLSATQTALRYFWGGSILWAQEVSEIAIISSYFFGISYVFKTRQYILIEFLVVAFPLRIQLLMYVLAQVLTIFFAVSVTWLFFLFLPTLFNMRTTLLSWPAWLLPAPIALACALIALTSAYYLAFGVWALRQRHDASSLDALERLAVTNTPLAAAE